MGWNYIQAYGSLEDALPHIRCVRMLATNCSDQLRMESPLSAQARISVRKVTLPPRREGINRYNLANADKIKHSYNETITNFYAFMIAQALVADKFAGMQHNLSCI
jgi:hypothetical protein